MKKNQYHDSLGHIATTAGPDAAGLAARLDAVSRRIAARRRRGLDTEGPPTAQDIARANALERAWDYDRLTVAGVFYPDLASAEAARAAQAQAGKGVNL